MHVAVSPLKKENMIKSTVICNKRVKRSNCFKGLFLSLVAKSIQYLLLMYDFNHVAKNQGSRSQKCFYFLDLKTVHSLEPLDMML